MAGGLLDRLAGLCLVSREFCFRNAGAFSPVLRPPQPSSGGLFIWS